ncbi:MAG: hypothetical protein PVI80_01120 [Anaerolineae bacterium]|jgi:hypothetical protein
MNESTAKPTGTQHQQEKASITRGVVRWLLRIVIFVLIFAASLFQLATPLILGSLWALVPAVLTVGVTVVRTALEDRTLQAELDGYKEYAQETRSCLVPGF